MERISYKSFSRSRKSHNHVVSAIFGDLTVLTNSFLFDFTHIVML